MLNYHKIARDIEKLIDGEVSVSNADLKKASKDASLFTVRPQIVVYPKDKHDIQAIIRYINNLKQAENEAKPLSSGEGFGVRLSLTARAAGTDMSGGPLNDSIILDVTKHMHKIYEIHDMSVVCEPGVYFRDLEKLLNKVGLMYPSYPASKDLCCLGGIVSNNSSGEKTLLYGSTKDWVEEIEMVLADGTIFNFHEITFNELEKFLSEDIKDFTDVDRGGIFVRQIYEDILRVIDENKNLIESERPKVSKNSSGYFLWEVIDWKKETVNLAKLVCGSQGTLGIITKVKLKLVQKKPYSQMLTVLMPDLNDLVPMVEEILKFKPEAIETFDDHTFKIAMKFLPSLIWKLKGSIFSLGFSFIPEAWMALTGGVPKLILMAEFTGATQKEANQKTEYALSQIQQFKYSARVTKNEIELQKYWLFRRESFNLLRSKLRGFRTAPFVEDIIVPIENMREFIPQMQAILDKYKYIYTVAGHAGNGNFHIIPLMKLNTKEEIVTIRKTNQEVFSLVQKYQGSISAEHNDGLVRTPYLHFMFSNEMLELFKKVKNIFDPLNIFNPGKKVGGSVAENYSKIELNM
jgi:FAD/FMN-containing dehydrogenase